MSAVKNIVFITNPASGTSVKKPGAQFIRSFFDESFKLSFFETSKSGNACELTSNAIHDGADAVVAIGGDGTVNEIARTLNGTGCVLGILPCGSGNGLARHHGISLKMDSAIATIRKFKVIDHDAVSINGMLSFNVSGIGFDAHVAHLFGKNGNRGFSNYIKLVIREFYSYKEQKITVEFNNCEITQPVMLAAFANGSQFGNNARIAPGADTNDGIADIILVRKMNTFRLPWFMYQVFNRQVDNSDFSTLLRGDKFTIRCENEMPLHIDGEPAGTSKNFVIQNLHSTLKLIIP